MKKQILTAAILFTLTGCATTHVPSVPPPPGAERLTAEKVNRGMDDNDRGQLVQLISTAKPTETITTGSFDFTSYNIFINDQGQPCRTYSVNVRHFFGDKESKQTACRVNGLWVPSNTSTPIQ